jgi:hypothetical protein
MRAYTLMEVISAINQHYKKEETILFNIYTGPCSTWRVLLFSSIIAIKHFVVKLRTCVLVTVSPGLGGGD